MSTLQGHFEDSSGNLILPWSADVVSNLETTTTASQAYSIGDYIGFNNKICKVTTAISSGDTLTEGTNLSEVSLCQEFSDHMVASDGVAFTIQNYIDGVYTS